MLSTSKIGGAGGAAAPDANFSAVTMLLHGDGTNGAQNNTFIDSSINNLTITRNGNTTQGTFSPYTRTAPYNVTNNGGSSYFDGTGDYLLTATNAAFTLAGDFTIEGWMYMVSGNDISLFTLGDANASTGIQVYYYNSAIRMYSGATIIASSTVPNFNAWIHVAVVRSGTTVTLYLNGVSNGTATKSTTYSGAFYTGASSVGPGEYMNGYISDIRVVKGTAVYTTTFTPPTAPLTAITNTSYLLNMTNAGIYDHAMLNDLETVSSAQVSTSVVKFGTGSMSFNGSSSYLQGPVNPSYAFSTGDFTVEFWVYVTSYTATATTVVRTAGTSGWVFQFDAASSNKMIFYANGVARLTDTASPSTGTWTYFAVVRSGSTLTMYRNGTSVATTTYATAINPTGVLLVGCGGDSVNTAYGLNGYIDDLRITKGYARTITTPTAAFPNN